MTWRAGRRKTAVIALVFVTAMAAGCAGKSPSLNRPDVAIADGFYLELWILGRERYATLYRVNGARKLGFGGGGDASNRRISWVGTLTAEQYGELQDLLERHGWFTGTVSTTGDPPERVTRVRLHWPGGSRKFKVKGDSQDIEPVRQLLSDAARQRLRRDLEQLPEAGEERYR